MLFILGKVSNCSVPKVSSLAAQRIKSLPAMKETQVRSLCREKSPGEESGNPLRYSCLKDPRGQRGLAGYSPWGREESDTTARLHVCVFKVSSQVALVVKNPPANAGDERRVVSLGWEDPPGGGNGSPLQYSCPENPRNIKDWRATVHAVAGQHVGPCGRIEHEQGEQAPSCGQQRLQRKGERDRS